jgi:ribulose-5-phosphate 4-epimerase/fuculose-1-phosphate aldolase
MKESDAREQIAAMGESLFNRGLTAGSSGNLSIRLEDHFLITPTNVSLGRLDPAKISEIDSEGILLSGDPPSKEAFLHLALYSKRPGDRAVIHLHSTYSAAVSCMTGLPSDSCLPPLTAYFVMKVNRLPLVPYYRPGDLELAEAVGKLAVNHHAILLANHGPVVSGVSLEAAVYAMEELEETAKLFLLLQGKDTSLLNPDQIETLKTVFGLSQ